ncbi:hypothetical protein H4R33_005327 [Dimargaris cristalligena]|uniref:HSP20-like chaperone n=1 Tax=Dimargaris cristalligena TaxID=215637 RepID=A0A4P9ZTL8_9FUNG|nr:hypothetical protein H4R33_005327 [Dimargaris cristalligena]RKP36825.1 HSP20-like chaperone [Dimargaris cristalligena]|eukprot:RKP36825.1 HSP20-like chaperone [Dimargaris cristalligena]
MSIKKYWFKDAFFTSFQNGKDLTKEPISNEKHLPVCVKCSLHHHTLMPGYYSAFNLTKHTCEHVHAYLHNHFLCGCHTAFHATEICSTHGCWHPSIDVYETDKEITIQVELPGVDGSKVICDVYKGSLMIVGETQRDSTLQKALTHGERDVGSFCRRIPLPEPVLANAKDSKASFANGILTVVLPKKK